MSKFWNTKYRIYQTSNIMRNITLDTSKWNNYPGRLLYHQHGYFLKGLSHEIDFKNIDKNLQNLA